MAHHLEDVARLPSSELERLLRYGEPPDFAALDGFLFRGANVTVPGSVLFPRFVKGFSAPLAGYNLRAKRGAPGEPWELADGARPFGFYECRRVRAGDGRALHPGSLLLDYGRRARANWLGPTALLRDFLVQVEPLNADLYLGKAYLAL